MPLSALPARASSGIVDQKKYERRVASSKALKRLRGQILPDTYGSLYPVEEMRGQEDFGDGGLETVRIRPSCSDMSTSPMRPSISAVFGGRRKALRANVVRICLAHVASAPVVIAQTNTFVRRASVAGSANNSSARALAAPSTASNNTG